MYYCYIKKFRTLDVQAQGSFNPSINYDGKLIEYFQILFEEKHLFKLKLAHKRTFVRSTQF